LTYAAFGKLININFSGVTSAFTMQFRVDNRVYVNPGHTVFFQYPSSLTVGTESSTASVIPIDINDGFDPDLSDAWDADADGVDDFEDLYPTDPDLN